jgi:hypothetical protein
VDNRVNNFCGKGCEYPCCSPDQGGLGCTLAPGNGGPPNRNSAAVRARDDRRPAGRHPPLAYSAALPTAWAPWIPPMQRGPRPHSFGHTEPMVRPAGFGAGERVDVTSCMEARNAPWPAGDGLDGAEAVPCIAGEPLRCGGGCAVHLRFGVQCTCDSGIPGCRKSAWSSKSAWSRRTACRALHTTVRGSFRCFDQCWFRWRRAGGVGVAK